MPSKKCSKCGEEKPLTEFHKRVASKDGLQPHCKECERKKKRQHYLDKAEAIKEQMRRYYSENREAVKAKVRKYYEQNAEAKNAYQRQWERDNPEKVAAYAQKRRARKAGVPSDGIPVDITDKPCYVCGAPAEAVDHVVPLAKGGHDTVDNKAPICHSCNSAKRDHTWPGQPDWDEFVKRRNQND